MASALQYQVTPFAYLLGYKALITLLEHFSITLPYLVFDHSEFISSLSTKYIGDASVTHSM